MADEDTQYIGGNQLLRIKSIWLINHCEIILVADEDTQYIGLMQFHKQNHCEINRSNINWNVITAEH